MSSTLDHNELLEIVISAARDLSDTDSASIFLYEGSMERMVVVASTNINILDDQHSPSLDKSVQSWIIRTGQPLILQKAKEDLRTYPEIKPFDTSVVRNMMAVPLVTKGNVIGILEVINKPSDSPFNEQDSVLLQVLASQAAAAIENVRLFQQTDLIADFMHEFKTPLMALTTASEILAREDLIPFHQELLVMIQSETARLSRMAQDFLDLSRLESGRIRLEHEPVDLAKIAQDIVILQRPQADKSDIKIDTQIIDPLPPVIGDHDRLKQVLLNLTSNAIKYNKKDGAVTVKLQSVGQEVLVEIIDTGPGIAKENVPHLFERFYRVRDDEGFSEGAGLGLPIAKRIVENHGGRIEVSSKLGVGSTFRCYLPAADEMIYE